MKSIVSYIRESHNEEIERVVFKYDKGTKDVVAFFPDQRFGTNIMSYAHVGQHSEASLEYARECKPCKNADDYKELYDELVSIGYNLKVVNKLS